MINASISSVQSSKTKFNEVTGINSITKLSAELKEEILKDETFCFLCITGKKVSSVKYIRTIKDNYNNMYTLSLKAALDFVKDVMYSKFAILNPEDIGMVLIGLDKQVFKLVTTELNSSEFNVKVGNSIENIKVCFGINT